MNATVGGAIGGIQSGDAVTKIEIVWKLGAETEADAQAAVPPRAVTLTAAGDITAFQSGTYALSSTALLSGQTYTPAVRVTESRDGVDGFVGGWCAGTVFTPSLINDSFSGNNGDLPSSVYWNAPVNYTDGTLAAGSRAGVTIQAGKLNFHAQLGTATDNEVLLLTKNTIPFIAGRSVQADFNSLCVASQINASYQDLYVCGQDYMPNGNGFPQKNILIAWLFYNGSTHKLELNSIDNSGTLTATPIYSQTIASAPGTVKLVLTDATHVQLQVGGTSVGTFAHTATLGTQITPGFRFTTQLNSAMADYNVDNFIVI